MYSYRTERYRQKREIGMKVVILAGGLGTRIMEESQYRPKPMVEIGGMPILWHIMKIYSCYGYNEFIICAGYKQHVIKEFFANYYMHRCDVTFDYTSGDGIVTEYHGEEPWKVTVADTGYLTMTGGRIKRIQKYIQDEPFMMTYGDGVCDVDIGKLVETHRRHGKIATITTVEQDQTKGVLDVGKEGFVKSFREKQKKDVSIINAGYMVLQPEIFDYLEDDRTVFEQEPLQRLAEEGQLMSYFHKGFWQCMDSIKEEWYLDSLWKSQQAPWKIW